LNFKPSFFKEFPHSIVLLFFIIVVATLATHVIPAGTFDRVLIDGRLRVIAGTYRLIAKQPLGLMDMFIAMPKGFGVAIEVIWVVMASGIMFGILEKSKMIENVVGSLIFKLGLKRRLMIVVVLTYLFGLLGVVVGYENNIAMIPIAATISLALGGDLMLAAAIAVGGVTVGFGLSPINPYTVGTGHKIAELPMFSGALMRSMLCFSALTVLAYFNRRYFKKIIKDSKLSLTQGIDQSGFGLTKDLSSYRLQTKDLLILFIFITGLVFMLFGVFQWHWYLNQISAIFLMISIIAGLAAGMNGRMIGETTFQSISLVAPGAFMVGFAATIKVILEEASIGDTIAYELAQSLNGLSVYGSALGMSLAQLLINFAIPSGSGQALATLPIMIPTGELLGLTRQTTILAFQIGDGVSNLMNPALGGLIAMLSLCRVTFDRWLKFIVPVMGVILLMSWLYLLVAVAIDWGPF
jgi:uncharacterized ion transporter superfamily protein YfcC